MITVLADENIACLDAYFDKHPTIKLIKTTGRQLHQTAQKIRPDALFVRSVTHIDNKLVQSVKFVGTATLGIDHIDTDFLTKNHIGFASSAGSSKHSVAQYVITAIYHLNKSLLNTQKTIGIIGLGNIGGVLADYAQSLGLSVLGFDPFLPTSMINNSTLDNLLAKSDIVSIHTPLTSAGTHPTANMVNDDFLAKLNRHCVLINASRGKVIDDNALIKDIDKTCRKVVLDVFASEPVIDQYLLNRLAIATPHIAGYTLDAKIVGTDMIYQAFCAYFGLPILTHANQLLPPNPFDWQTAKKIIQNYQNLDDFYNIAYDDFLLREVNQNGVNAQAFDKLRKNYFLKRQWQYD